MEVLDLNDLQEEKSCQGVLIDNSLFFATILFFKIYFERHFVFSESGKCQVALIGAGSDKNEFLLLENCCDDDKRRETIFISDS